MSTRTPCTLFVALAFGLAACGWHDPKAANSLGNVDTGTRVMVMDKATWETVAVRQLRDKRTEGNRVEVSAELVNRSDATIKIKVSADFFDAAGHSTEANEIWQRMEIPAGASQVFTSTSVSGKVQEYRISIQAQ